ncbi:MAG: hypothetical protein PHT15_09640 [Gallionellaceae bacterium]|nr:hypothetical protein [Gallionellaceae bacterium]MDD5181506.1 hypothetical protein [Gallionellaceae bacterium]
MTTPTLRENILNVLAGSSSQMPVNLTKLQSLIAPKVKLAELVSTLDAMCQSSELQTCNGIKDGKAYVSYWISGMMPPAWSPPRRDAVSVQKPAAELTRKRKKSNPR